MAARVQNGRITPASIPLGLLTLDRKSLATFLAIFEDSTAISLITDKLGDFGDGARAKYAAWKDGSSIVFQEHFTKRIIQTASEIETGDASDYTLRFALWAHIREAFELEPWIAISPRDLDNIANDIGAAISVSVAQKRQAAENAALSKKEFEYWKRLAKEANPFGSKGIAPVPFDEAVREAVFALLGAALESSETPDANKRDLISKIRGELSSLDQNVLKEAKVDSLTDDAIQKFIARGGGLLGLMGAVEAAGFGAYILAAQASAIIPLVGGKTLVTALFVMSHPLFVLPVLFAAGVFGAKGLRKSVRRAFAVSVGSLLALRGLDGKMLERTDTARMFFDCRNLIQQTRSQDNFISVSREDEYRHLASSLSVGISLPPDDHATRSVIRLLDAPVGHIEKEQPIERFLFPKKSDNRETVALAGLTLGDFLFDLSAIDPKVLEAADFSHKMDLGDPFSFADFAEHVSSLSAAAIRGHEANLLGYTAERIVAARLTERGYVVSIPESASQPGYDLTVDGNPLQDDGIPLNVDGIEFQVKCIAPENFHILVEHFKNYSDIPVIVNSEISEVIAEKSPEWADKVFFIEGYTYEFTDGLVETAIKAGTEIGDYELVPLIATMSVIRNAHGWWVGQQSLKDASFNVALESAAKGMIAVAGGFAGKGIGALMFGPAGAYIFGGVLAVAATTESHWISDRIDSVIDSDRDTALSLAAQSLLQTCIEHLEAKLLGIEVKANSLPNNEISEAMRYRWKWETVFTKGKINEARLILDGKLSSGERLAVAALEFASNSGVHPAWLQDDYTKLLELMKMPRDRWQKAATRFSNAFRGLGKK
jgi:hypothetical protein